MKADIHPDYRSVTVNCGCGNSFETRSTLGTEVLKVDICNACHPFYTGKHKIVDTEGKVDQFMRRYGSLKKSKGADEEAKGGADSK